ncbi:MAG: hypothetical protein M1826_002055 [Phylliscum demangeonii]|nr:MAG: hypothetical protein M1826_002055 [Phylliscum demangeonii]
MPLVQVPPQSADSAPQSTNASSASRIKNSSTYDKNFLQHLMERCIDSYNDEFDLPDDWEERQNGLMPARGSLSPSRFPDANFRDFLIKTNRAEREQDVMNHCFPFIHGDFDFPSKKNVVFNNLVPLTEHSLVDAKPDFVDGADPATINPRVCRDLEIDVTQTIKDKDPVERTIVVQKSYIIPCRTTAYPALPNFFLEAKGPGGTAGVAKIQACYNGVLGARRLRLPQPASEQRTHAIAAANARADRLSAMPPPMPPTISLDSSALDTLALAGPSANAVTASHNAELPTPLSSPLSSLLSSPDSMELDAEPGPQSADVADVSHDADPPPLPPFFPSASLVDAHMSDDI